MASHNAKTAEKEIFKRWYPMSKVQRKAAGFPLDYKGLSKQLGVHRQTFAQWALDCQEEGIFKVKGKQGRPQRGIRSGLIKKIGELPAEMQGIDFAAVTEEWWTEDKINDMNQAVYDSFMGKGKGNPNAMKLAALLTGKLAEKKEMKFVISADDYFKIRREAAGRVSQSEGERNGDRGVLPESSILLPKDGISTEPQHLKDGEVESLAIPT